VALKRWVLISSASGFADANGAVPSIRIAISRPERRSRTGMDRIWISSSVALGNGVAATSRSAASGVGRKWMSIRLAPTPIQPIRAVRKARYRVPGNSVQLLPISAARAIAQADAPVIEEAREGRPAFEHLVIASARSLPPDSFARCSRSQFSRSATRTLDHWPERRAAPDSGRK
jgi:hypothetical protein